MAKHADQLPQKDEIIQLFVYRYLLDRPNDVVKIDKDIDDLVVYPERIVESYPAEWQCFVQSALRRHPEPQRVHEQAAVMLQRPGDFPGYAAMYEKILRALKVYDANNVYVIKHPVRKAIERLIK